LFEIKHHLLLNHRELLNDSELADAVRALLITCPELDTPVKLFRYLELQTNYSPLLSPTVQQPVLENTTPSTFHPIPSCSTGNKAAVPLTVNESPIEKNTSFFSFSPPVTHVSPCETTTEKNTSFCPFPPPATHVVPCETTTEKDTPFCPFSPPRRLFRPVQSPHPSVLQILHLYSRLRNGQDLFPRGDFKIWDLLFLMLPPPHRV
jgi:hypothetical protein